jgi:hypothetical protein
VEMTEIAQYHSRIVISVANIVMSPSTFSSNPSIKGAPVFFSHFLLIPANRLLWQANVCFFMPARLRIEGTGRLCGSLRGARAGEGERKDRGIQLR